ncbi:MAG: phosphotriesterase family protein [Aggregatilineales bacterium]
MEFQTVTGPVPVEQVRLADAHAHLWIDPPPGVADDYRLELKDQVRIQAELTDFHAAGGTTVVDCQPGGCGRDGTMLVKFSQATGLHVTASTGFHLKRYYPPEYWLWSASVDIAAAYFIEELTVGMRETGPGVRATVIKVGYDGAVDGQQQVLMEAAAIAAHQTGATILFHTEQGRNVEALLPFFTGRGVGATQLYMCHMDKRPDLGLHSELARAGVLLGYDTFDRPKYDPEHGVWPLIGEMVVDGLEKSVAIGLDMAYSSMWRHYGGQPGMLMLLETIVPRLHAEGMSETDVGRLTAQNIAERLAGQPPQAKG